MKEGNFNLELSLKFKENKQSNAEHNIQGFKQLAKKEEFLDARMKHKNPANHIFSANSNIVGLPKPAEVFEVKEERPRFDRKPDFGGAEQRDVKRRDFSRRPNERDEKRDFSRRPNEKDEKRNFSRRPNDRDEKREFSTKRRENTDRKFACYNCGAEGHLSRNCTSESAEGNFTVKAGAKITGDTNSNAKPAQKPKKSFACYNCGGEGHLSRNCTSATVAKDQKITERKDIDRRGARGYETRERAENKDTDRRGARGYETRENGENNYDRRAMAKDAPVKKYAQSRNTYEGEKLPSTYNYKGKKINIDADFPELE